MHRLWLVFAYFLHGSKCIYEWPLNLFLFTCAHGCFNGNLHTNGRMHTLVSVTVQMYERDKNTFTIK